LGARIDESQPGEYSVHMKPAHQKVLEEVLRLPLEARAALAGHLLDSLDDAVDEDAESAWSKEIARRVDDLDRGKVKTIPWSVARRQILGRAGGRAKR
jgi:putative addiction module component (TIGR02574 family)